MSANEYKRIGNFIYQPFCVTAYLHAKLADFTKSYWKPALKFEMNFKPQTIKTSGL